MNYKLYCFLIIFLVSFYCKAQDSRQTSASEIKLGLEKLNTTGSVLYIAAHPDDENTRLLAYLSKELKVRTGYLSLTRGDGGQNLIGKEQAELLGLIRTQELLAARRADGAEQFFTRANDFGFSKTSKESLEIWDQEKILADMVWIIRNFKPDVIITRFPEDARAGHGQHSASAILARKAFFAAADPNRFPEQLKHVKIWQAKRLVWNTFNFNAANNTTSADQLQINVGLYNRLLGRSYGEIAAESRTNHKSQGFGTASQRGDFTEFFTHVAGIEAKKDLFEGVDLTWKRFAYENMLSNLINKVNQEFDLTNPSKSVGTLLQIKALIDKTGISYKTEQINSLIIACAGIWFEMTSADAQYAVGEAIPAKIQAIARVPANFPLKISVGETLSKQTAILLEPNQFISKTTEIRFRDPKIRQPYWLESEPLKGSFQVKNPFEIGMPEANADFSAEFILSIGDTKINVQRPVMYKFTDPVRGEIYQPLVIAPPVTATFSEKALIFSGNEPKKIEVKLQNFSKSNSGFIQPKVPAGWIVVPEVIKFDFQNKGETRTVEFSISPFGKLSSGTLEMAIIIGDKSYNQGIKEISYEHIPKQTLFPLAAARVESLELKTGGKNIGYIAGAGDLVAESLSQIGYKITILSPHEVLSTNLTGFDAIVTGIRLYNIENEVKTIQPKLLDYVEKGGVLVVQYNVNTPLQLTNIGPFPFTITRSRVTEENAKVSFLAANDALLNYPNKITEKDFDSWVQERGLYFVSDANKAYTSILSMHDSDEEPNSGSLITTNYGQGKFVYTSLSFFRQLPAGVPGAYRLFVNLISKENQKNE